MNNDGRPELLIGARTAGADLAGAAYLVFGKTDGTTVNLGDVAGGNGGFKILGDNPNDFAGSSVSGLGDVNGDGRADFAVTAGDTAYVVFGKPDGFSVDLGNVAEGEAGGFALTTAAGFNFSSITNLGDINGDGISDMAVGMTGANNNTGMTYVVYGKPSADAINLDTMGTNAGFQIVGEKFGDRAGHSISGIGDMNGDGRPDILIGAFGNDAIGDLSSSFRGAAYVVFAEARAYGNVLSNDTDPDSGNLKSVQGVVAGNVPGVLTTGVGSTIVGIYGALTINADGYWSYFADPNDPDTLALAPGETDTDVFTYTMRNGPGATSSTTLTVSVTGAPAIVPPGGSFLGFAGDDIADATDGTLIGFTVGTVAQLQDASGDTFRPGDGIDSIVAGGGDDIIIWTGGPDDALLNGGGGTDTLRIDANFNDPGDTQIVNIETVRLTTTATLVLDGQSEAFTIIGSAGNDTITAGSGEDIIAGDAGQDQLAGGAGNDELTGGGDADTFRFAELGSGHLDTITDYSFAQGDWIDVSALLDANFGAGSNINDFVQLVATGTNDITVQLDIDGMGAGGFEDLAVLSGSTPPATRCGSSSRTRFMSSTSLSPRISRRPSPARPGTIRRMPATAHSPVSPVALSRSFRTRPATLSCWAMAATAWSPAAATMRLFSPMPVSPPANRSTAAPAPTPSPGPRRISTRISICRKAISSMSRRCRSATYSSPSGPASRCQRRNGPRSAASRSLMLATSSHAPSSAPATSPASRRCRPRHRSSTSSFAAPPATTTSPREAHSSTPSFSEARAGTSTSATAPTH